jgi:hypothetical protein
MRLSQNWSNSSVPTTRIEIRKPEREYRITREFIPAPFPIRERVLPLN